MIVNIFDYSIKNKKTSIKMYITSLRKKLITANKRNYKKEEERGKVYEEIGQKQKKKQQH